MKIIKGKNSRYEYELQEKIGHGAFSDVFKAKRIADELTVAVKIINKPMTRTNAQIVKNEIEVMKDLTHDNIVKFYEEFEENGIRYIIIEYCAHGDLESYKKKVKENIPEYFVKEIIKGLLNAIQYLNSKLIVHRDLKPANILISADLKLKLADFGFSKKLPKADSLMKTSVGTPMFFPPQIFKKEQYNCTCDVWSIGVITYFLLTNTYPFMPRPEDGTGFEALKKAVLEREFEIKSNLSSNAQNFLRLCLEKRFIQRKRVSELIAHPWFDKKDRMGNTSQNIENMLAKHFGKVNNNTLGQQICVGMFKHCFTNHYQLLEKANHISILDIQRNIATLQNDYSGNKEILSAYLQLLQLRMEKLSEKKIAFCYEIDEGIKTTMANEVSLPLSVLKIFMRKKSQLENMIKTHNIQPAPSKDKVDQIVLLFILEQIEKMGEDTSKNKFDLLQSLLKLTFDEHQQSKIVIQWGQNPAFEDPLLMRPIIILMTGFKQMKLSEWINKDDESLKDVMNEVTSTWLIRNEVKESNETGDEIKSLAAFLMRQMQTCLKQSFEVEELLIS